MGDKGEGGVLNLPNVPNRTFLIFFFFTFFKYGKDYLFFETDSTRSCGDYHKIIFCPATFGSGFKSKKKPIVDPVRVIYYFLP